MTSQNCESAQRYNAEMLQRSNWLRINLPQPRPSLKPINGWVIEHFPVDGFKRALSEYTRAEQKLGLAAPVNLRARKRLAAAMIGEDVGEPIRTPVQFGDIVLNGDEFETMVEDMMRRSEESVRISDRMEVTQELPIVSMAEAQRIARLDGEVGQRPNEDVTPNLNRLEIDWCGQQIANSAVSRPILCLQSIPARVLRSQRQTHLADDSASRYQNAQ